MKSLIIIFILSFYLFSCNAQTKENILSEKYSSSEKPSEYNLNLKKDSTFSYTIGFGGSLTAKCNGKWTYNKIEDSIKLYCDKETPLESLTSTYMSHRINTFKIIEKGRKLKNKKIILKTK